MLNIIPTPQSVIATLQGEKTPFQKAETVFIDEELKKSRHNARNFDTVDAMLGAIARREEMPDVQESNPSYLSSLSP